VVIRSGRSPAERIDSSTEDAMAHFTTNPTHFDPYKNFKFRVKWDGRFVAGVSKVSTLQRTTGVVTHGEGGDPSSSAKSLSRTQVHAIILERGVTYDAEFELWANTVHNSAEGSGTETSLRDSRKDMILEVYNEAGQLALAYKIFRAWVSEFQALPDLDANAIAIERLKLETEGWERDQEVKEPAEFPILVSSPSSPHPTS
jgi:phage tail-like protein